MIVKVAEPTMRANSTAKHAIASSRASLFAAALVMSAIFWLLSWHGDTAESIVATWIRSETFAHGFLIIPISAWLIWRRRHVLGTLALQPSFLALPLLALLGFGWFLGHLAGTGIVQQYCLVLMIPLLVWIILGSQVAMALAFPLFYLLFAVPFGEFLLPPLMDHTANFTVRALRLTGIPVYREGLFFTLPSGNWSVVEACSGLRYLIASVTLGFLYAHLTYRSFSRRAIFVALSFIVPIIANWFRAYMIVMIGHLSSMQYAVGVDHLLYGWIFFGVVMLILFWIGSYWREDDRPHQRVPDAVVKVAENRPPMQAIMMATLTSAVLVAIWPAAATRIDDAGSRVLPILPVPSATGGWRPVPGHLATWTPGYWNPSVWINQVYDNDGKRVGLYIGYYRNQRNGAELITSRNMLVRNRDRAWRKIEERDQTLPVNHEGLSLIETKLQSRSMQLLVWHWYWVDGRYVLNPHWAKFLQMKSTLSGRGDDGAVIIVYTELDIGGKRATGRLQAFVDSMLPAVTESLQSAR